MKRSDLYTYNYNHRFKIKKNFEVRRSDWISPLDDNFSGDAMTDHGGVDVGINPNLCKINKRAILVNKQVENLDL